MTYLNKTYNDNLNSNELNSIVKNLLETRALSVIDILKIKETNNYSIINLMNIYPSLINYIPINLLIKFKPLIISHLPLLSSINIFNIETQEILFKKCEDVLSDTTIKNIILNSSNPYNLNKVNKYLFKKKTINRHLNKDLFYFSSRLTLKNKENVYFNRKFKPYEVEQLYVLMDDNLFIKCLNNTIYNYEELIYPESILKFIKLIDLDILLKTSMLPSDKYLKFLLIGFSNKTYLKIFLKNTNIKLNKSLYFFNDNLKLFYLQENKWLDFNDLIKLNSIYNNLDWNSIYNKRIKSLSEEDLINIFNLNDNINNELINNFISQNNGRLNNIKLLSKNKLFKEHILKELKSRFTSC